VAVTNEKEFREWLEGQPQEISVVVAYRAAMRVLPLATQLKNFDGEERLTLATFRACLISGVAVVVPMLDVKKAADSANRAARAGVRAAAADAAMKKSAAVAADAAKAVNATTRHTAHIAAFDAARAARMAARAATKAARAAYATAAARAAAYADTALTPDQMLAESITLPSDLEAVIGPVRDAPHNALTLGKSQDSPWSFWARWYDAAMAGDPMPWALQEKVALIPNKIWEAGPEAVAAEIARIEAEFIADDAQLLETLVLDASVPVYSAKTVAASNPDRIALHLSRVDDALDDLVALGGNNGLTEDTAEYRIIKRLVRKYGDDPERIAFDLTDVNRSISRQFESGE
jgi:hypothetical protein